MVALKQSVLRTLYMFSVAILRNAVGCTNYKLEFNQDRKPDLSGSSVYMMNFSTDCFVMYWGTGRVSTELDYSMVVGMCILRIVVEPRSSMRF